MLSARPRPIWSFLIAFGAALTLPVLTVVGYMAWSLADAQRAHLENDVKDVNEQILYSLERQYNADMTALRTLATSPALRDDHLDAFAKQAAAMIDEIPAFAGIVLRDAGGNVMIDTGKGFSAQLPENFLRPNEAPPTLSDIVIGPDYEQSGYYISTPVAIGGHVRYYLIARIGLGRLASVLQGQAINEGYFASIVDSNGIIMARATGSEKQYGKRLVGVGPSSPHTVIWHGLNPEGIPIYGIFNRSDSMNWGATTGIAQSLLNESMRRSLAWLAITASAIFAASCIVAYLLSRILANATNKLTTAAIDLGEGRQVTDFSTTVTEVNIVGKALQSASEKLRHNAEALSAANHTLERKVEERTAELAAKTELLETTVANMDQGLIVIGPDQRLRLFNDTAAAFMHLPTGLLASHPRVTDILQYCLANGIFSSVPDDVDIMLSRDRLVPGQTIVNEREQRDGTVIEIRTVPLADGSLVRTYTDMTPRKHAERHLEYLARHDALTGLPNRLLFRERLELAIADNRHRGTPFSVLFIDLDHFKTINDRHGHDVGDALLMQISARFKSALRMEDTVARLGGDEFAILQTATNDADDSIRLARRLLERVAGDYRIGDVVVNAGLSIGIASSETCGNDADVLLKKADVALYEAKRQGRGTFRFAGVVKAQRKAS